MFFLQLRQLMWKNYLVRIRSKVRHYSNVFKVVVTISSFFTVLTRHE